MDNLFTPRLEQRMRAVESKLVTQIKIWPLNFSSLVILLLLLSVQYIEFDLQQKDSHAHGISRRFYLTLFSMPATRLKPLNAVTTHVTMSNEQVHT